MTRTIAGFPASGRTGQPRARLEVHRAGLAELLRGWALRLCDFPQGIFSMALQTAALPSLSALAARRDQEELSPEPSLSACASLYSWQSPATALLWACRANRRAAVFTRRVRGANRWRGTSQRADGPRPRDLAGWPRSGSCGACYYALGDTRTPVDRCGHGSVRVRDSWALCCGSLRACRGRLGRTGSSACRC